MLLTFCYYLLEPLLSLLCFPLPSATEGHQSRKQAQREREGVFWMPSNGPDGVYPECGTQAWREREYTSIDPPDAVDNVAQGHSNNHSSHTDDNEVNGTAAVTLGTGWLLGVFGRRGSPISSVALAGAGAAWNAANACWYFLYYLDAVGAQYDQSGDGAVCVCKVWIPFHDKHYSVRDLNGRFALWDDDGNHSIN